MTRNRSVVGVVAFVVLLTAGQAFAGPIGDTGTFNQIRVAGYQGSPNNGGGEFTAYNLNGLNNVSYADVTKNIPGTPNNVDSFQTFCIETNEFTTNPMNFVVTSAASGGGILGPSPDPISKGTAWLYSQFAKGALDGYDYDPADGHRAADAALLQKAIWALEDEDGNPDYSVSGNAYYTLAMNHIGGGVVGVEADAAQGYLGVYVLNNTKNDGSAAQDFLYYTVPDGGATLALLGFSLMGLGIMRRKFRT